MSVKPQRQVRVLSTADDVEACTAAWQRDIPPGPLGPLDRPAWVAAAAATLAPTDGLRVVVVEEGSALIGVAPLVVGPSGALELLGAETMAEPADFVARDRDALLALARAVVRLGHPLRLARLPARSGTPRALRAAGHGWVTVRPADSWPTLLLDSAWMAPEGRLSGRRASDLRRARRRAEAAGIVQVRHHRPGPGGVEPLLAQAEAVEAAGWKGRAGSALIHDPVRRAFFQSWARRAAADGSLRISFLWIDGAAAAVQVAAESAQRRWILKIGHTDAHARCSPGLLLLLDSVRDAAARGLDAVEMLGVVEPWTRAWTPHESATVSVRHYPTTIAGVRRLAIDGGRAVSGRLQRERHRPLAPSTAEADA